MLSIHVTLLNTREKASFDNNKVSALFQHQFFSSSPSVELSVVAMFAFRTNTLSPLSRASLSGDSCS